MLSSKNGSIIKKKVKFKFSMFFRNFLSNRSRSKVFNAFGFFYYFIFTGI